MGEILNSAINSVSNSLGAFCRFITANDTHASGSHQAGFLMPIAAYPIIFNKEKERGVNEDKWVKVRWQDDLETNNRMIYYGKAKNELRITRFGDKFPFFEEDHVGDFLIIAKHTDEDYTGYVLSTEEDIETFLAYFNLSPEKTNQIIDVTATEKPQTRMSHLMDEIISRFPDFPETRVMSEAARECFNRVYSITAEAIRQRPDELIIDWSNTEETLFKCLEEKLYSPIISKPFESVADFANVANMVLNRRKSRAGKSFEHHLSGLFKTNNLIFEEQVVTENKKRPDFVFPSGKCYHNFEFPADDLTVLGAKTTCKERWRQILSEAARVEVKYLCTLQPSISKAQLKEMKRSNVRLVVPKGLIGNYPAECRADISDLKGFISFIHAKQERIPKHYLFTSK